MPENRLRHGGYGRIEESTRGWALVGASNQFGYMFPNLANHPDCRLPEESPARIAEVRHDLEALGGMMGRQGADQGNARTTPAGYTYWGQFIDHDIAASNFDALAGRDITDLFTPLPPTQVIARLVNLRRPALDLDSVLGDDPTGQDKCFYDADGIRLKTGQNVIERLNGRVLGEIPPGGGSGGASPDLNRDLPRNAAGAAQIPDERNDENLIVAQLHVAFIRFYNALVDRLAVRLYGAALRCEAARLARWHYQWLVVNDYLMTVAQQGVVRDVLANHGRFYGRFSDTPGVTPLLPLEFSAAGFRFGHSMIRGSYDYNRNFGRGGLLKSSAALEDLFKFTGAGGGACPALPHNWIIEWDRFFGEQEVDEMHRARRIDSGLALPLSAMKNQLVDLKLPPGLPSQREEEMKAIFVHLAKRNLLRGYLLSLPTGQSVASAMRAAGIAGIQELSTDQLKGADDDLNQLLARAGFLERTPLWYYILKEAQITPDPDAASGRQATSNKLGPVGSRIVAETIIGLLRSDPDSYLVQAPAFHPGRDPDGLFPGTDSPTMMDLLRLAGVAV